MSAAKGTANLMAGDRGQKALSGVVTSKEDKANLMAGDKGQKALSGAVASKKDKAAAAEKRKRDRDGHHFPNVLFMRVERKCWSYYFR